MFAPRQSSPSGNTVSKKRSAVVTSRKGALVREAAALHSRKLQVLAWGTPVQCDGFTTTPSLKRRRNVARVRITAPIEGWCSSRMLTRKPKKAGQSKALERLIRQIVVGVASAQTTARLLQSQPDAAFARPPKRIKKKKPATPTTKRVVVDLDEANFEIITRATKGDKADWLVAFGAPWCTYSQQLQLVLPALCTDLTATRVGVVDVTKSPRLRFRFNVKAIPTVVVFHQGSMYEYTGERSLKALRKFAIGGFKRRKPHAVPACRRDVFAAIVEPPKAPPVVHRGSNGSTDDAALSVADLKAAAAALPPPPLPQGDAIEDADLFAPGATKQPAELLSRDSRPCDHAVVASRV